MKSAKGELPLPLCSNFRQESVRPPTTSQVPGRRGASDCIEGRQVSYYGGSKRSCPDEGHHKGLSKRYCGKPERGLFGPQGGNSRADGRKRRGQIHADENPLRSRAARGGGNRDQRREGRALLAERRHREGNRHGAPALHAGPLPHRGGKHRAGHGAPQARHVPRLCKGGLPHRGVRRTVQPPGRPPCQGHGHSGRHETEGGNPQGARAGRADPHPRRAHRRSDNTGNDRALPRAHSF